VGADGSLASVEARYVLADSSLDLAGTIVARDPATGVRLVRVGGRVVLLSSVTGLYDDPGDTWSGGPVTYTRRRCDGGTLSVLLETDAHLYRSAQTVTARSAGAVRRVSIEPTEQATLIVPLRPGAARTCIAVFSTARLLVRADVDPSSSDRRPLGAHFLRF